MTPGRLTLALALCVLGCNALGSDASTPIPARPPGVIRVAQALQDSPGPHLTEAIIAGEFVFVGNSNDQFAVYRLQGDTLELALRDPGLIEGRRCTTLAVHAPTDSLYCGNDEWRGIWRYDIGDPLAPLADGDDYNPPLEGLRVSDMVVVGDRLVVARYDRGLGTIEIDADGRLVNLVEQLDVGNVRKLDSDADGRLWALTGDRGLLVLEPDPSGGWVERWQLDLDGPPLGLGVDDSAPGHARAAVGLGSAGLALVELDPDADTLRLTSTLHPPGVVSSADLRGDVAVAVTLLGVFAYDLREPAQWPEDPREEQPREAFDEGGARLLGFVPAGPWDRPGDSGTLLDGTLFERDGRLELLTTDWTWVERLALDPDGFPAGLDVRRGEYLAAEDETVEIALRNPTPFTLRVEYQPGGDDHWQHATIGPHATTTVRLPADRFEIDTAHQFVIFRVYDGDDVVDALAVTVLRRAPVSASPVADHGRPPPGEPFLPFLLATGWPGSIEPLPLPTPGVAQRVVFYGLDCAAMWPEVEDVLWRVRSGLVGKDEIVLISHVDPTSESAFDRWGLGDATWGYFIGPFFPPEFAEQNPFEDIYEGGFVIYELPAAAHHPTDYAYDADGVVTLVEREYRGEHELD